MSIPETMAEYMRRPSLSTSGYCSEGMENGILSIYDLRGFLHLRSSYQFDELGRSLKWGVWSGESDVQKKWFLGVIR